MIYFTVTAGEHIKQFTLLPAASLHLKSRRPGWCGPGDRALACGPKGGQFRPRRARSPAGGVPEATDRCFSPSLPLSKNKILKKIKNLKSSQLSLERNTNILSVILKGHLQKSVSP